MKRTLAFLLLLVNLVLCSAPAAIAQRVNLTTANPPSLVQGPLSANAADVAFTACDTTNLNSFTCTGRELLFVQNSHGSTQYTFTVTSVKDDMGRTGDITTYAMDAGEFACVGPFTLKGWRQNDGKVYLQGSNAAIKFLVVRIPDSI